MVLRRGVRREVRLSRSARRYGGAIRYVYRFPHAELLVDVRGPTARSARDGLLRSWLRRSLHLLRSEQRRASWGTVLVRRRPRSLGHPSELRRSRILVHVRDEELGQECEGLRGSGVRRALFLPCPRRHLDDRGPLRREVAARYASAAALARLVPLAKLRGVWQALRRLWRVFRSVWQALRSVWQLFYSTWRVVRSVWQALRGVWQALRRLWRALRSIWRALRSVWRAVRSVWRALRRLCLSARRLCRRSRGLRRGASLGAGPHLVLWQGARELLHGLRALAKDEIGRAHV